MEHEDRHVACEKRRQRRCPALRGRGAGGQHERADEAYGDKAQRRSARAEYERYATRALRSIESSSSAGTGRE